MARRSRRTLVSISVADRCSRLEILTAIFQCCVTPGPVQVLALSLLIHHDDADREVAYDREFTLSPLVEALDRSAEYGITVVSMKRDWKVVFE